MNLPFTVDQFLEILVAYNTAVWPIQPVAYVLGAAAVILVFKRSRSGDRIISLILSFMWIWTGLVYHLMFFTRINKAAYLFGILTISAGFLILRTGYPKSELTFRWRAGLIPSLGALFILYATILYPLLGIWSGHVYPRSPMFGITPCPVTIFTFGMFLLSPEKVPVHLLVIPFLWSLVGGSAAWNLGVPQDYGLLVAGVAGTALVLWQNYRKRP